jgi:hypothetical protein
MRLVVFGGRDCRDRELVWDELDQFVLNDSLVSSIANLIIICGHDPWEPHHQGVDQLAYEWARARRVPVATFPAPWHRLGLRAGPARNARMLDMHPDHGLQFPGGRGTANMRDNLDAAGVPVTEVHDARVS